MTDTDTSTSRQPYITCAIALVAGWFAARYFDVIAPGLDVKDWPALGGTIASIGATMLGFTLAALAILASISNTHLVKMMLRTGHYIDLMHTLFLGAGMMLCCAAFGFFIMFGYVPNETAFHSLVAVHFAALITVFDIGRKYWLVLTNIRSEEDQ